MSIWSHNFYLHYMATEMFLCNSGCTVTNEQAEDLYGDMDDVDGSDDSDDSEDSAAGSCDASAEFLELPRALLLH